MVAPRVSVILPTYNEKENIVEIIPDINRILASIAHELIVVDDNSPDRTWEAAQNLNAPWTQVIRRVHDRGLRKSILEGISISRGEIVVWLDADYSQSPELIPKLIEMVNSGNPICVASRYITGGSMVSGVWRNLTSRALNLFARSLLTKKVTDYTTGFVACRRIVVKQLGLRGGFGEYCIDFLWRAHRAGLCIAEIPYAYVPREKGKTKTFRSFSSFIRHGLVYSGTVLRLRLERNPK